MSQKLINLNTDLRQLREEGYFIQIIGGYLVMREVPYRNRQGKVCRGRLISTLTLAGDKTQFPDTHVVQFDGEEPCDVNGSPLDKIINARQDFDLGNAGRAKFSFSSKPTGSYKDYYEKMSTYASLLSGPATAIDPNVTPRVYRKPDDEDCSVFNYTETASDRAGIGALTSSLAREKVAIIGLGGTGSYILDLVAKTPVSEIRLFDGDDFLQHNAFRAPGAPMLEELREVPKKVDYFAKIYSKMHRNIIPRAVAMSKPCLHELDGVTFAFLSMDGGEAKRQIVEKLEHLGIAFIDVGMGLELVAGSLGGILRVTTSTPEKREHFRTRVNLNDGKGPDVYASNIQVADLNALNASLAVIKWKKLRCFYRDLDHEHHCTYTTDGNLILNGDQP